MACSGAPTLASHLLSVSSVNAIYAGLREIAVTEAAANGGRPSDKVALNMERARIIPATGKFILVNSAFGLAGQMLKGGGPERFAAAVDFGLPLIVAVAIGGQIGSLLALKFLPQKWIRWGTAALTLWVGMRLLSA